MIFRRRVLFIGILLLIIGGMSFGYAFLETTLSINGDTKIYKVKYQVGLKNVQIAEGSFLNKESETSPARNTVTISEDKKTVSFDVTLTESGQFFEFTFDVANEGTLDGKLDSVVVTQSDEDISIKEFISYTKIGVPVRDSLLKPGTTNTRRATIRLEAVDEVPEGGYHYTESITFNYSVVR